MEGTGCSQQVLSRVATNPGTLQGPALGIWGEHFSVEWNHYDEYQRRMKNLQVVMIKGGRYMLAVSTRRRSVTQRWTSSSENLVAWASTVRMWASPIASYRGELVPNRRVNDH